MTKDTVCEGEEVVLQGRETLLPILPSTSTVSENSSEWVWVRQTFHENLSSSIKQLRNWDQVLHELQSPASRPLDVFAAGERLNVLYSINSELTLVIESGWYEGNDPC